MDTVPGSQDENAISPWGRPGSVVPAGQPAAAPRSMVPVGSEALPPPSSGAVVPAARVAITATADAPPVIEMRKISRIYEMGHVRVRALEQVDVTVGQGEFVAIVGPSGSGKTTLMNLIGCLDRPTAGSYRLAGRVVAGLDDDALAAVRSRLIGFIFQSFNLLPRTSALENVATPLLYQGVTRRERLQRAKAALERLGLADRLDHEPSELSGGQQQRVAIARAIVTEPALILADEPTGNLDSATGAEVMAVLRELHAAGRTIVLITHDPAIAANAERQIHTLDGHIVAGTAA